MRKITEQRGITLIALVVTIIVLIILAGVSISMLVGENGMITQAQKAKENMELAQNVEKQQLNQLEQTINNVDGDAVKIGETLYPSIQKAVDSIEKTDSSVTITLIRDCTENITIIQNKNVTLNLNGHILLGGIQNNGTLDVTNGNIKNPRGITIENTGTLNIIDGNIINEQGSNTIYNNGGTLNIKGGTITGEMVTILSEGVAPHVEITGGEVRGKIQAAIDMKAGTLVITAGKIMNINEAASEEEGAYRGVALEVNAGEASLSGGMIISAKGRAIGNHAILKIQGVQIESGSHTTQEQSMISTVCNFGEGIITMTSGSITNTTGTCAVMNGSKATFTKTGGTITGTTSGI